MEIQEFTAMIDDLFAYFQTTTPQQRIIGIWWEEVSFIPGGDPMRWIKQQIQGMDRLPRNIAKAIRASWDEYKTAHPEAMSYNMRAKTNCKSCGGTGFLFFRDSENVRRVAFCSDCENGFETVSEGATARLSISQLAANGYHIESNGA